MSKFALFVLFAFQLLLIESLLRLSRSVLKKKPHRNPKLSGVPNDHILEPINRSDFPILDQEIYPGKQLVYLDNGASSHKPIQVIEVMNEYYRNFHSNVHRGAHALSMKATDMYENARNEVQTFINARRREEIVFTKGATEAINLVALSYGQTLNPGDEIILSVMEHHSNIVPWHLLAQQRGVVLKFVPLTSDMTFDLEQYKSLLTSKTKLVAVSYASNVLGSVNPVRDIIQLARRCNNDIVVLLDACQAVPHMPVDVQSLDADFIVASSHKMCGPTGAGFLYGKYELLERMPPVFGGGEMIDTVKLSHSTFALPPSRFEAGTPAIAECIGLGEACKYLKQIGMDRIFEHEKQLGKYLYEELSKIPDLVVYGPDSSKESRTGITAFNSKKVHATDLSFFLDQEGVAVRTGHHCTQPLHELLQAKGSCRASLYFYNSKADVDIFIEKLKDTLLMFENLKF